MPYASYTNQGHHASGRGTINNITTNYQNSTPNSLEELERHCSHTAAFDSAARFDPPRCAESTRLSILHIIEEWINSPDWNHNTVPSSLFWLHGGAGVGKSALVQSLSETCQEKEQLGASFFFSRSDPTRNKGDHLIPTLVSHLVDTFEGIGPLVQDRISRNRALFTKTYQVQIQQLLVEPLLALKTQGTLATHPRLIVIDGLDECKNRDIQCELVRVIACSIRRIPYPLRFLVTSRPEAHIMHVFNYNPDLQAIKVHRYNLSDDPDADMDIRKFLEEEFAEIHRVHRLGRYLPHDWPDEDTIISLVERSSGHFIYASTVIRYIRSPKHRPDDRLEVILRLRPPQEGDRPYAQLDALYALIFLCVDNRGQLESICLILGILYFGSTNTGFFAEFRAYITTIEELLELKAGDLVLLLDPMLSLIALDGDQVRILHKSLFDYLLDFSRSGHLPFDLRRVHELGATRILKENIVKDNCNMTNFRNFAYHCRHGHLNDVLKDYLHSLEVPCPKSVATIPKTHPSWSTELRFLLSLMWDFFRTLSREDFDSTGQIYDQYVGKWMGYLRSAVPIQRHFEPPSRTVVDLPPTLLQEVDVLKLKLDDLLMEWKPRHFNAIDMGTTPVKHIAIIKQEHSVCSEVIVSDSTHVVTSSLVFGDYFIHSYSFVISRDMDMDMPLAVRTYSRHGNLYHNGWVPVVGRDVVGATKRYLKSAEMHLFSDAHQKYGIMEY